MAFRLTDK